MSLRMDVECIGGLHQVLQNNIVHALSPDNWYLRKETTKRSSVFACGRGMHWRHQLLQNNNLHALSPDNCYWRKQQLLKRSGVFACGMHWRHQVLQIIIATHKTNITLFVCGAMTTFKKVRCLCVWNALDTSTAAK